MNQALLINADSANLESLVLNKNLYTSSSIGWKLFDAPSASGPIMIINEIKIAKIVSFCQFVLISYQSLLVPFSLMCCG